MWAAVTWPAGRDRPTTAGCRCSRWRRRRCSGCRSPRRCAARCARPLVGARRDQLRRVPVPLADLRRVDERTGLGRPAVRRPGRRHVAVAVLSFLLARAPRAAGHTPGGDGPARRRRAVVSRPPSPSCPRRAAGRARAPRRGAARHGRRVAPGPASTLPRPRPPRPAPRRRRRRRSPRDHARPSDHDHDDHSRAAAARRNRPDRRSIMVVGDSTAWAPARDGGVGRDHPDSPRSASAGSGFGFIRSGRLARRTSTTDRSTCDGCSSAAARRSWRSCARTSWCSCPRSRLEDHV